MDALKIEMEGITASFRYPHFTWGKQPTYVTPPPSTIYGLISAAVGRWLEPATLKFAYHFKYTSKSDDVEHIHAVIGSNGRFFYRGGKYAKNVEGNINPMKREFLFQPQLTLYLNCVDLSDAFREPRYPLVLGRSQDLIILRSIKIVSLAKHDSVFMEHTILPWEYRPLTKIGLSLMLPRFIDTEHNRQATLARYVYLNQRLYSKMDREHRVSSNHVLMNVGESDRMFWADPEVIDDYGFTRGVIFHGFVE